MKVVCLLLFLGLLASVGTSWAIDEGELVVRLVTSFGNFEDDGTIVLTNVDTGRTIRRDWRPSLGRRTIAIRGLPLGDYRVEVIARGFSAEKDLGVTVKRGRSYKTICLWQHLPIDSVRSRALAAHVKGRVQGTSESEKKAWVTLVGVNCGTRYEVETDDDGSFIIDGISDGIYVAIVTRVNGKPTLHAVTIRLGENRLIL
jgi:hypothetical protein